MFSKRYWLLSSCLGFALVQAGNGFGRSKKTTEQTVVGVQIAEPIDINAILSDCGRTRLSKAVQQSDAAQVDWLLAHRDIDVNKSDKLNAATPLTLAIARYRNSRNSNCIGIIKKLLDHPEIDVNKSAYTMTPLEYAFLVQDSALVDLFLAHPKIENSVKMLDLDRLFKVDQKSDLAEFISLKLAEYARWHSLSKPDLERSPMEMGLRSAWLGVVHVASAGPLYSR